MPRYRMNAFDRELVQALQNEDLHFDMSMFCKRGTEADSPLCGTACCIAGHIVGTLRPAMARALIAAAPDTFLLEGYVNGIKSKALNYERLANAIYEAETGKKCNLDFYAFDAPTGSVGLERLTRKQAIAHIRGRSVRWPRKPATEIHRVNP